jgi:hypothetical protein
MAVRSRAHVKKCSLHDIKQQSLLLLLLFHMSLILVCLISFFLLSTYLHLFTSFPLLHLFPHSPLLRLRSLSMPLFSVRCYMVLLSTFQQIPWRRQGLVCRYRSRIVFGASSVRILAAIFNILIEVIRVRLDGTIRCHMVSDEGSIVKKITQNSYDRWNKFALVYSSCFTSKLRKETIQRRQSG